MIDIEELKSYLKKLQKTVSSAELTLFGYSIAKKNRIDDLFCCIIALFPDSYKKALKNRTLRPDQFQSVTAFNRLSKVIKRPAFLLSDCYAYRLPDANDLFKLINKDIELDINRLEGQV